MASIVVAGDTSGTVTLTAPLVAGTNTITLPTSTGTMALTASPTFTGTATIPTATVTTLNAPSGVLATQNGMTGIPKAWVCYANAGTILSAFNVSSVTQNATGYFTINFTTAMANANYAWTQSTQSPGSGAPVLAETGAYGARSTTSFGLRSGYYFSGGWADYSGFGYNGIAVFSS